MDTILPIPTDRPTDHALRALGPALRRIRGALRHRPATDRGPSAALLRAIVAEIATREPAAAGWSPTLLRGGDPAVLALGPRGGEPAAILRIARRAAPGLLAARTAQELARDEMGSASAVVPTIVGSGTTDGSLWVVEGALPGEPGRTRMADAASRAAAVAGVARAIRPLHAAAAVRPVGGEDLEAWIAARTRLVGAVAGDTGAGPGLWPAETAARLGVALRDRSLAIGRIHGDLWLENVRFQPGTDTVTAIVDWDSSAQGEPPLQDLVHLAITTRRRAERRDFGPVVVDALDAARGAPDRPITLGSLLGQTGTTGATGPGSDLLDDPIAPELDPVATLLLAWLRFVEVNVTRHPELASDRRWIDANVRRVVGWP